MNGWIIALIVFLSLILCLLLVWGISYAVWSSQRLTVERPKLSGLVPVVLPSIGEYLGLWYEHRRMNSWFEPADFTNVTAEYGTTDDARVISVTNTGYNKDGVKVVSKGTAGITNVEGVLDVSFFPPFSGLYVIIGYRKDWAIVASPSREYLWLLGRKLSSPGSDIDEWFRTTAIANGYTGSATQGIAGVVNVSHA